MTDAAPESGGNAPFRSLVDDLLRLYAAAAEKEAPPAMTDAVTQALLLALGSGLQTTALDALAAAQQAQTRLFLDAVERQQRGSLLALEATAKAVTEILSVSSPPRDAAPAAESEAGHGA